jgi:hypothetical protein
LSVQAQGPAPESFLSGRVGHVGPRRAAALRVADRALDLWLGVRGVPGRLDGLATQVPGRKVLAVCAYRPDSPRFEAAAAELRGSRHEVRLAFGSTAELRGGKFQNLNAILEEAGRRDEDWTLVVDDDVLLPAHFLDRMLGVCECFGLHLAQPALTLASHGAWRVTRRRARPLARATRFVEIGPVTLLAREVAAELTPFPDLRFGWGLDLHWAALAARRGWLLGVVDALPVRHDLAGVASAYPHAEAVAEARRFLAGREFLPASDADQTLRELA